MNPRDAISIKRPKVQMSTLKLAAFAGSGMKKSFNLRVGIQHKGPKSSFSVAHVALSHSFFFFCT